MNLFARIEADFLAAYKAKDEARVSVLRLLKAALKNRQVELLRPLTDEEILEVVARQIKQRAESIEQFRAAGRDDLVRRESLEEQILRTYMPPPLSDADVALLVERAIAALGAATPKDMGRVMQALMAEVKGRVDGKKLSALVRARLSA